MNTDPTDAKRHLYGQRPSMCGPTSWREGPAVPSLRPRNQVQGV